MSEPESSVANILKLMCGGGEDAVYVKLDNGNEYTVAFCGKTTATRPHFPLKYQHTTIAEEEAELELVLQMAQRQREEV